MWILDSDSEPDSWVLDSKRFGFESQNKLRKWTLYCVVIVQLKKVLYWRSCTLPTEQNFLHRPPYLFQYYISSMWGNVRIFYHLCSIRVGLRLHKTFLYDKTLVLLWEIIIIIPHALRETKKVFCRNIYFFHLYICVCWIFIRVWLERTLQKCVSHKLNGIQ